MNYVYALVALISGALAGITVLAWALGLLAPTTSAALITASTVVSFLISGRISD